MRTPTRKNLRTRKPVGELSAKPSVRSTTG